DGLCVAGEMCTDSICYGPNSRWGTLGGDVHHSGFNVNERGTPPLATAWMTALDAGARLWPVVSDGVNVYVAEGPESTTQRLWALSQTDGHVLWAHDFGSVFGMGQPTVESGAICIAQSAGPMFSFMHAVSASLGQVLWSQPIDSQSNTYWAPLAAPGGRLYFDGGTFDGLYGLRT